MTSKSLKTWMRDEYKTHRVGDLALVQGGTVIDPPGKDEGSGYLVS